MCSMGTSYSSTFPSTPPADPDDPISVVTHDQRAFESVEQMLSHWDRPHRLSYHWMITLDHDPSAVMVSQRCQERLPSHGLDLISPGSLHLTVQRLGYVDEVSPARLNAVLSKFQDHCPDLSPFRLQLLPLAGSPGALRLSVAPWSPLLDLYRRVAQASGRDDLEPLALFRPHVGIAYSNCMQAAHPFIEAARQARSISPVHITINSIQLVELYRSDHQYRWRTIVNFPFLN
jgi:2'-5' RNA ligase